MKERSTTLTNYIPPNDRSFFNLTGLDLVSSCSSLCDPASIGDLKINSLNDLRKMVSISTAVIPSRKSDIRILIDPELYSSL